MTDAVDWEGRRSHSLYLSFLVMLLFTATQHLGLQKFSDWPKEPSQFPELHFLWRLVEPQAKRKLQWRMHRSMRVPHFLPSHPLSIFPVEAEFILVWGIIAETILVIGRIILWITIRSCAQS